MRSDCERHRGAEGEEQESAVGPGRAQWGHPGPGACPMASPATLLVVSAPRTQPQPLAPGGCQILPRASRRGRGAQVSARGLRLGSGRGASLETSPLESHFQAPPAVPLLPNNESFLFLSGCVGPLLAPRCIGATPPAEQPRHTVPWESHPVPPRPQAPHGAVLGL